MLSITMTSIHIEAESAFLSKKRRRSDVRSIDLHAFSLIAQSAQNAGQLKSILIRTLRSSSVEFLQLATYRRLQYGSVIWSALAAEAGSVHPTAEAIAHRAISSGAPQRWTFDGGNAHTPSDAAWFNALNENAIVSGVSVALHGANDTCHVFHFGAQDAAYFDGGRAGLEIFSTIGFIVSQRLATWQRQSTTNKAFDAPLSARELEVIRWCKDGKSYPEIAQILGISTKTVEFHIANAMRKLGVNQKISAIVEAARQGLIDL